MALLSTIIGRGLLSARPAAGTAGALYFATDTGITYRDSGSAWVAFSVPGLVYEFDAASTADGDPGAGTLRFNNATPGSVTVVYIDDQPHNTDADLGTVFDNITGARVLFQQADDPAKYLLGEVTADVDGTGYWKLTVTVDSSGTLIDDGALVSVIVLGGGSGGGGALTAAEVARYRRAPYYCCLADWHFAYGQNPATGNQKGVLTPSTTGQTTNSDADRASTRFQSATTGAVGWSSSVSIVLGTHNPHLRFDCYIEDNDDGCIWAGFVEGTSLTINTADPGVRAVAFRALNGTDTNWQAVTTAGGGSLTVTDTGVAIGTGWHDFEIFTDDQGTTWYFYIDGSLVATHTTNLPNATTGTMGIRCRCANVTSTQRGLFLSYANLHAGETPTV